MNTANKITVARVLMIPLLLAALALDFPGNHYVALGIFILASLSDMLDGYIARSRNMVTDFGKFMDPIADKMLVVSAMLMLTAEGTIPAWVVAVVVAREFAVSALRLVAVEGGRVIAAGWSGKVKTASTMVCICLMLLPPVPWWLNNICAGVILVTTVWSGVEYFVKNRDVLNWSDI